MYTVLTGVAGLTCLTGLTGLHGLAGVLFEATEVATKQDPLPSSHEVSHSNPCQPHPLISHTHYCFLHFTITHTSLMLVPSSFSSSLSLLSPSSSLPLSYPPHSPWRRRSLPFCHCFVSALTPTRPSAITVPLRTGSTRYTSTIPTHGMFNTTLSVLQPP